LPTYFLESVIGNGFDQTVPETEIEQLDIGIPPVLAVTAAAVLVDVLNPMGWRISSENQLCYR
jgi:hypothetical protein